MDNIVAENYKSGTAGAAGTIAGKRARSRERSGFAALMTSLLKIGFIGFGGGCALIPVIEREVVTNERLVSREEFNKDIVAACITPGALPVEISTGLGMKAYGIKGMLTAALAIAFPGSLCTVMILSLLSGAGNGLLRQIQCLSVGLSAFIAALLLIYSVNTVKEARKSGAKRIRRTLLVILGVFLLSCGKTLSGMLPFMNGSYLFGFSTISILGISFFGILYTQCRFNKVNLAVSAVLIGVYALCSGGISLIDSPLVRGIDILLMTVLAVRGLIFSVRDDLRNSTKSINRALVRRNKQALTSELLSWLLFTLLLSIPAILVTGQTVGYLLRGFLSSLMSFGGGDAYLSVADGMFVDTGIVSNTEFYSLLVPVANVLPGSILCKILTGVGYYLGYDITGSTAGGLLVALAGFACSIAASGFVFCAIYHIYECMEQISIFQVISRWIRPIIAGLLLSVMVSMISQNLKTGLSIGAAQGPVLLLTVGILALNLFLYIKKRKSNLFLIGVSAVLGLALTNLMILL